MRTNQNILEITGSPAQVWGNVLIPARGTVSLKISGDILQSTVKTGLEKKDSWTRIQRIDSVEISEAPIYPLLALGGFMSFMFLGALFNFPSFGSLMLLIGIGLIVFALTSKRRCLVIMSDRNTIAVFMNKSPETYQQFAINLLLIARQLNTPTNLQTKNRQADTQAA